MSADILRDKFLNFFKSKKHKIIESDSLVPKDDPTVLFTPAGMNQFKKEFLGFDSGYKRAATAQRCLRTDDLDKVGKTTSHHTFFEMLGNFSFGDYFKEEAISWAWEFLTKELKISKEKLWVSVYKEDEETYKIWKDLIKLPPQKIIKLGDKENFWPSEAKSKGPNGPCGPCSEIFFDQGLEAGCKKPSCSPACDCGRFVEVWNLVFTQFNRKEDGALEPLPNKNIDTGMGLERLTAVMQAKKNNFETDLFQPIIEEIREHRQGLSPKGTLPVFQKELIYAIADHIRAVIFAIYDGVLPSNEARGYVVRKLIRKGTLCLRSLGMKQAFLYKLVPLVSGIMKVPYPQLEERKENIAQIILAEEKNFISTLSSSENLFKEKFIAVIKSKDKEEAGRLAFKLYDTHGIPLELTKDWLDKYHIELSQEAYTQELEGQKNRSKLLSSMKGDVFSAKGLNLSLKETKFLGYRDYSVKAKVEKIIKEDREVKKIVTGDGVQIILDKTPFYPEAGGQVGDAGEFIKGKSIFEVFDTKKIGKAIVHLGRVKQGSFKKGDFIASKINTERRFSIARNHTATHLLQSALRKVLGPHVRQQGSLVAEERLRFDFTHFKDITQAELDRIEGIVNQHSIANYKLSKKQLTLAEAKKQGALAFFGEKYEKQVRMVSIGDISKELCGGTHLDATGQIGLFKITQESAVASGIRRIEAVTGTSAYKAVKKEEELLEEITSSLNVSRENVLVEIEKKNSRLKELERQLESKKTDFLKNSIDSDISAKKNINGIDLISHVDENANSVRKAVDLIKGRVEKNSVILSSTADNLKQQIFLAIGVTQDLCAKGVDASRMVKVIAPEIGGSGGGRPDFAQAGGNKPENFQKVVAKLEEIVTNLR